MPKKKRVHPRPAAYDRGATPYFHGRTQILRDFEKILSDAQVSRKGTIHLIQGAPGAGKSALLDQCERKAKSQGWKVVQITADVLWNPWKMMRALGYMQIPTPDKIALSVSDLIQLEVSSSKTKKPLIRNLLGRRKRKPLLLMIDEAQKIYSPGKHKDKQYEDISGLLEIIHNGYLDKPIVLLAAGLRTTLSAFKALDISRFGGKNTVELGRLSDESARAIMHDWIMIEANVNDDPTEWIDAMVKETHGWARHVHSYAKYASDHLKENGGVMTPDGLTKVMEVGRQGRIQYYKQRLSEFDGDDVMYLSRAIAGIRSGKPFTKKIITSELKRNYNEQKAESLFRKFMEEGVIAKDDQAYSIPIPSMHEWLKSELRSTQERLRLSKEVPDENPDVYHMPKQKLSSDNYHSKSDRDRPDTR